MSMTIATTLTVKFEDDGAVSAPITVTYDHERDVIALQQGAHQVWIPSDDALDFVAALRKWVEEDN